MRHLRHSPGPLRPPPQIFNNLVYNVDGAGLGVWGGYNILVAHNTVYKVGKRSHMIEVNLGDHSCDGEDGTELACCLPSGCSVAHC